MDPKSIVAKQQLARLALLENNPNQALEFLQGLSGDDAQQAYLLGVAQSQSLDAEAQARAESNLRRAIQLQPDFAPAYAALADVYLRHANRTAQAISLAQKAVLLDQAAYPSWYVLTHSYLQQQNYVQAAWAAKMALLTSRNSEERKPIEELLSNVTEFRSLAGSEAADPKAVPRSQANERPTLKRRSAPPGDEALVLKGTVTSVGCNALQLTMILQAEGVSHPFRADNFLELRVFEPGKSQPITMDLCEELEGKTLTVVYRTASSSGAPGTIITLEIVR